jgi:hypothetical protein
MGDGTGVLKMYYLAVRADGKKKIGLACFLEVWLACPGSPNLVGCPTKKEVRSILPFVPPGIKYGAGFLTWGTK